MSSERLPKPVGPYSQAIQAGDLIFLSGQIAINPSTGVVEETDVKGQTRRIIENTKAFLESVGLSLSDVVKATVYLTSAEHFTEMNEVYREFFKHEPPARSTVVTQLPVKGAIVEIDFIAYRGR